MKLILTADVEGLGAKGAVVDVSTGYGRNFLLPQQLAVKATPGALRQMEAALRLKEAIRQREVEEAQNLAGQLADTRIVIAARAGDEGKLFGSIGVTEVVDAVKSITAVVIERNAVRLEEPIKTIGSHEVTIAPHKEVRFPLAIEVIPD